MSLEFLMCMTVIKTFAMISFVPPHANHILLFLFMNKPYEGIRHSVGEDVTELSQLCTLIPCSLNVWRHRRQASGVITHWIPQPYTEYFHTQRGARAELIYAHTCVRVPFE